MSKLKFSGNTFFLQESALYCRIRFHNLVQGSVDHFEDTLQRIVATAYSKLYPVNYKSKTILKLFPVFYETRCIRGNIQDGVAL